MPELTPMVALGGQEIKEDWRQQYWKQFCHDCPNYVRVHTAMPPDRADELLKINGWRRRSGGGWLCPNCVRSSQAKAASETDPGETDPGVSVETSEGRAMAEALALLLDWAEWMGGWEAPCWQYAEKVLASYRKARGLDESQGESQGESHAEEAAPSHEQPTI